MSECPSHALTTEDKHMEHESEPQHRSKTKLDQSSRIQKNLNELLMKGLFTAKSEWISRPNKNEIDIDTINYAYVAQLHFHVRQIKYAFIEILLDPI